MSNQVIVAIALVSLLLTCASNSPSLKGDESKFLFCTINPSETHLELFYKDDSGKTYKNARALKSDLAQNGKELLFCMNGGMFDKSNAPVGLYIEDGEKIKNINRVKNARGNFHLVPNGVFYLKKDKSAHVIQTDEFIESADVEFATQSGPMLIVNGEYHSAFNEGSNNLHIRNGVGVLPNGDLLFAMSKQKVNFYDFATLFKQNGCDNALYLDGAISRTYLPEKGSTDLGGNFGVLVAAFKEK